MAYQIECKAPPFRLGIEARTRKEKHYIASSGMMFSMGREGYKSNNNVVDSSQYHVVWTPKYRRPVLVGAIRKRCEQFIRQVATKYDAEIMALDTMPDHVHLLCEVDPQFGMHRLVKNMKGASSHSLRKEFSVLRSRLPTLWTNSCFITTVGGAPLAVVKQYVENQKDV